MRIVMPPRLVLLVTLLLAPLLASCDLLLGTRVCTEIGCDSGVAIVLEQPPAGAFRIEASAGPTDGPRYVYQCSGSDCLARVFFPDFTPQRVFVTVVTDQGTARYEAAPRYEESRPNGRGCPPLCRRATIRLPSDQLGR